MNYFKSIHFYIIALLATFCYSCEDNVSWTETYTANVPVYMSLSDFRTTQAVSSSRDLEKPGKICMFGNILFINEIEKGIHIIDNSNPALPQNVGFLEIIGNIDMAIKDNYLYVDSYTDLVCFDIGNPKQPQFSGRKENAFPYVLPGTGNDYPIDAIDQSKGVVIGWEVKKITRKKENNYYPGPYYYDYGLSSDRTTAWNSVSGSSKTTSVTGSMARFSVVGDYLYVLTNYYLKTFSIKGTGIDLVNDLYITSNAETIFGYNNNLYIGTPSGMYIYSIAAPESPKYQSFINHIWGCDPVVVQGNYAYVTIRSGNFCGQNSSLLDVIDVSNPTSPVLKASFTMEEPYGLSIDGNTLFLCDKGLKVFDATNPLKIGEKLLTKFNNMHGFDVIAYDNLLMLIGNDGLYQYDYSDLNQVRPLSVIPVK